MAKESRIKLDLLRLHDSDAIERELVDYLINEVSNAKRQEVIRTFLKVGYALLAKGHFPNTTPSPSYQPPVRTTAAPSQHTEVPQGKQMAAPEPVQEVDQTPAPSFSLDHEEEEDVAPNNSDSNGSETGMEAFDPLSKMKASFNKK
ncbi:MAG: hypothetical protein N0C90_12930 [Candidatus Thiodiazotropha endolucinida]|nr:hypothetical protein [Candidatus Thiodiazotropha taylori]MCW4262265.1 hypothetical protein [Candidatus Thiodiazotropha endolucinida]